MNNFDRHTSKCCVCKVLISENTIHESSTIVGEGFDSMCVECAKNISQNKED